MSDRLVFDRHAALDRVEQDKTLFFELCSMLREDAETRLERLATAIEKGDAQALEQEAHALKGALGNCGAMVAFDRALFLERLGKGGTMSGADVALQALRQAVEDFYRAVDDFAA